MKFFHKTKPLIQMYTVDSCQIRLKNSRIYCLSLQTEKELSKDIQQLHYESVKRISLHDKALFRPCGAHQVQAKYELQYQYVKQHGTTVSKYNKVQN